MTFFFFAFITCISAIRVKCEVTSLVVILLCGANSPGTGEPNSVGLPRGLFVHLTDFPVATENAELR